MTIDLNAYRLLLEHRLASASNTLADFPRRLAENASHAMEWSLGIFEAAGEQAVCQRVIRAIVEGAALKAISQIAEQNALIGARHGSRSTSPASNLMAECMTSAWGRVALELRGEP
jgi:predicted aspartyl protease